MEFRLDVEMQGGVCVIRILGEVDICTAPELDARLRRVVAGGNMEVAVDLANCSYFDSEGIKALIRAEESMPEGGRITICGARGTVLRVFEISGLCRLFRMVPSVDDVRCG